MLTLYTFGDSILDCAHYNESDVDPGTLLLRNDDRLFPEFRGRDLASLGPCRLEHRARDGSTVEDLMEQTEGLEVEGPAIALLTVGGNDILRGLSSAGGPDLADFALDLEEALRALPIRPVLIGNVYDPSFGDDANNFLGSRADPGFARECLRRVNRILAEAAARHGGSLVDLHGHFLKGTRPGSPW
jgi:acyl-CoA thioesterase I